MRVIAGHKVLKEDRPSAVTLGKFDGYHLGHRKLVEKVLSFREEGYQTSIFTFCRPPRELVQADPGKVLTTNREKREIFAETGIDLLVEYPFDESVLRMEAEDFLRKVLVEGLKAKKIITGPDYCFGFKRKGNVAFLRDKAEEYGYELLVLPKEKAADGEVISSTLIRKAVEEGNMGRVRELLGNAYSITGEVVHGNHLGHRFGVPTINQLPEEEKLLPPNGVYTSRVTIEGETFMGVSNVGYKPTIQGKNPKGIETWIFDFDRDIYGKEVSVSLYDFQRPEQKFPSLEELIAQLHRDGEGSRNWFLRHPEIR